jgi:membrane associated rhomboid family serine protease
VIPLRDANPTRRTPYVTIALILACFAIFAYELYLQATSDDRALEAFLNNYGVVPRDLSAVLAQRNLVSPPVASVVTSMFLHGGVLHLLGNMLYLWIFGNNIEDRLGRPAFLVFYLAGGYAAALTQVAIEPNSGQPLIGASGAIAATLGAYVVLYPGARILSLVFLGFFYQLIPVPALIVLGFWFVLQIIDGFTSLGAAASDASGVAFFAHIGGFVLGLAVGLLIRGVFRFRRRPQFGVG